ncbi:MAG: hypothetical protein KJ040_00100 [Gammaproteobacteria bacterium]|nr:hypothetical protein [Gammaproteobacteria bacterium]
MRFRLSRLALLIATTIVAVGAMGVFATYREAGDELRDILDDDLEKQCRMLARFLAADPAGLEKKELQTLLTRSFRPDDEETLWVNVYNLETGQLASNQEHALQLAGPDSGALTLRWNGYTWEGYQRREGGLVVQLLRRTDLYEEVQGEILEEITMPVIAGTGVTLLLLATLIGFMLGPLSRLVRQLETRNADSLAPLNIWTPTIEVNILVATINRLMSGVDSVLQRERQFANDVAHELRTPLTTLKVELAGPEPDLPAIKAEVDRLARLVEQLLTLARLEQGRWHASFSEVPLHDVWARESGRFAGAAEQAGMTLSSDVRPTVVNGDPTLLQVLLRNLIGNVLRHCPTGTRIHVAIGTESGPDTLVVRDSGPGIPADQRAQMNAGFARLDSRSEGLGLGLAICRRIAEVHGAELQFLANSDGSSGLRVEVRFPP